jgi:hypothetical protein
MPLITYCPNPECEQVNIAKSVPDELAGEPITCGACFTVCVEPLESELDAGADVTA